MNQVLNEYYYILVVEATAKISRSGRYGLQLPDGDIGRVAFYAGGFVVGGYLIFVFVVAAGEQPAQKAGLWVFGEYLLVIRVTALALLLFTALGQPEFEQNHGIRCYESIR